MFDFLPAFDPVPLGGAPLVQVIAQVKFNVQSSLSTPPPGVGVLHDVLADQYPRLLAEQQAVITAAPGGVTTTQVPQWRLTDLKGQWAVVVAPEQLALETTATPPGSPCAAGCGRHWRRSTRSPAPGSANVSGCATSTMCRLTTTVRSSAGSAQSYSAWPRWTTGGRRWRRR